MDPLTTALTTHIDHLEQQITALRAARAVLAPERPSPSRPLARRAGGLVDRLRDAVRQSPQTDLTAAALRANLRGRASAPAFYKALRALVQGGELVEVRAARGRRPAQYRVGI